MSFSRYLRVRTVRQPDHRAVVMFLGPLLPVITVLILFWLLPGTSALTNRDISQNGSNQDKILLKSVWVIQRYTQNFIEDENSV